MSVKIDGLNSLNLGYFDSITISEEGKGGDILVSVKGNGGKSNSHAFSDRIKSLSKEDKVIEIIESSIHTYKIHGFTKLISLSRKDGKWSVVYGEDYNQLLRLQLFSPEFKGIFDKILNKYLQDRYNMFWKDDITNILLIFDDNKSKYDYVVQEYDYENEFGGDNYVHLNLMLKADGRFADFERKFIVDFLKYKLWEIGEEADIDHIWEYYNGTGVRYFKGTRIRCGKLNIYIPYQPRNDKDIYTIFNLVEEYNLQLKNIEEESKKRQLRMERI